MSDVRSKITTLTCTQLSSKYYKIVVPSPYPRFAPCVPVLGDSQSFVVFCTIMVVELSMQNKINKCQGLTADFTAIHTLDILCVLLVKGVSQCAYHWKIEKKPSQFLTTFRAKNVDTTCPCVISGWWAYSLTSILLVARRLTITDMYRCRLLRSFIPSVYVTFSQTQMN